MTNDSTPSNESKCSIFEILQYTCPMSPDGKSLFRCYPLPRVFKMCPGQPAVEMTAFVDIDRNGGVSIPQNFKPDSIQSRPWTEVLRYDRPISEESSIGTT